MQVPFRLRLRPAPAPAAALWLATADMRSLAALCARLGESGWPEVYAVAAGFLIVPDGAAPAGLPRAVRLRRLAGNLFMPAAADLEPALHPAEAADLTRQRGLVVLPGGRVLAFDPARLLSVADVIAPSALRREDWEPFPPRPERPEQLFRIERVGDDDTPEAIIERGKPEGAPDDPEAADALRPADGPPLRSAAARAGLGLGRLLAGLGRMLRWPGLARAGARLIARAVAGVPRLSERVLGRQEAALRELLRRLRSGDVERALRYAPAAASPDGPGTIDTGWKLGQRDTRYSLSALLGGGGPAAAWLAGGNTWAELAAEYRRLAREAAARGDHRRAAHIYGVLLRDLRLAADTLAAGGLHRDAAILYRDRLNDPRAAATAFEQAGDWDEALRLFRRTEQYDRAGDLLRRLGDEDEAMEMYRIAADRLARSGRPLAAGDFIRDRAGRADLAQTYYRAGWDGGGAEAVTCAERLLDHAFAVGDRAGVWGLIAEADERLAPPARERDAGRFYGAVARAARRATSDELRAELHDRALTALSGHLRASPAARPPGLISVLFGNEPAWSASLVRDAAFALRQSPDAESARPPSARRAVRLLDGLVTAAVVARGTTDVVVGSVTGEVVCWRADDGRVERVTNQGGPVAALATDRQAQRVVTLRLEGTEGRLRSYVRDQHGGIQYFAEREVTGRPDEPAHLLPGIHPFHGDYRCDVITASGLEQFWGSRLVPHGTHIWPAPPGPACLIDSSAAGPWAWAGSQVFDTRAVTAGVENQSHGLCELPWRPGVPPGSALSVPWMDWYPLSADQVELAGLTSEGELYWSRVGLVEGRLTHLGTSCVGHAGGYRAVALLGSGRLAGATATNKIQWLRVRGERLLEWAAPLHLNETLRVAVLAGTADELLIVLEDGWALQVLCPP